MKPGVVYIDAAVGSREFERPLSRRGVPCKIVPRLPADFAMVGCGKGGAEWKIGVERKTLSDLGSSLLMDRLFGTQLPRMLEEYDRIWLLIEGIWRHGAGDTIEVMGYDHARGVRGWVPSRVPLSWSQLQGWLLSYDEAVGGKGKRWRVNTESETVEWLATLLRWWCKPYHRHNGHLAIDQDRPMVNPVRALIHRPNDVQAFAYGIPRIGAKTALAVGRHFRSPVEMVNATIEEWREAGLGKVNAKEVWEWLRKRR